MTEFGRRRSSTCPSSIVAGRPVKDAESRPVSCTDWKEPSGKRACTSPQKSGTAHATPGRLRTRWTSISRRAMISLTCCTFASTTQTGELMLRRVAVVHIMIPQKTPACWLMRSEQKVRPLTSIAYFARSRNSMSRAMRSMVSSIRAGLGYSSSSSSFAPFL